MSGGRQLALDLRPWPALGRADFLESDCNANAVALVASWRSWPLGRLALTGPEGAGKTHLAHVWAAETGAEVIAAADLPEDVTTLGAKIVVEDVDRAGGAGAALFHLVNRVEADDGRLLMTGRAGPGLWPASSADLASRLAATQAAVLEPPDDRLFAALLLKLFDDRQSPVDPAAIDFLALRLERSFAAAERAVAALDRAALARRRKITAPLAREVLGL